MRNTIIIIALAATFMLAACSEGHKHHVEELYEKAQKLLNEEKIAEAITFLTEAAEQGHTEAQFYLGLCYDKGNSVAKNNQEAYKWLYKAAKQGHDEAQYYLGLYYVMGISVEKNRDEAIKWFKTAAELGNVKAQLMMERIYFDLVYDCFDSMTEEEHMHIDAFEWYKKVAEQGHAYAQYNLGRCYDNGYGVDRNQTEAFKWFKLAAEQGHADAIQALKNFK